MAIENKNIVIINRWNDDFGDYGKLLDHYSNKVAYIVNARGAIYLKNHPELPYMEQVVNDLGNVEEVAAAMIQIVNKLGNIDKIIALSELDLYMAGLMRDRYSVDGMSAKDTLNFVDKIDMKNCMADNNISTPRYIEDINEEKVLQFCENVGFPIVLKPRRGAASTGVKIVETIDELKTALAVIDNKAYECEEYISGPIVHIDGIVQNNTLSFVKPSEYMNTCFDYTLGKPIGSIIIDDPQMVEILANFTNNILNALKLVNGVFHLEVIIKEDNKPVFLEIAARQGGGEIVPLMKQLYNVDLVKSLFKIQIGEQLTVSPNDCDLIGGWLLIPEPKQVPCKVVKISKTSGLTTLSYQVLPEAGTILDGHGGYIDNGGRYMFVGQRKEIEADINKILSEYEIITEPA